MPDAPRRPRLAFVGLGWIGRRRMTAIAESGLADICALVDLDAAACADAACVAPGAIRGTTLADALETRPDGVILATPNALHAEQTIAALEAGAAVFCQKPLGRTAAEVTRIVATARHRNLLLGGDFSYRFTEALQIVRNLIRSGTLGEVFALDLAFHNAYGPDQPWFYNVRDAGGGCLLDLGIHLVDFVHWAFDQPVARVTSQLFASGSRLRAGDADTVEDFASGTIELSNGTVARLACSWRVSAGRDADISIVAYGTKGGAAFRNVDGSFYDFVAEHYCGTRSERLCSPPDRWGGRAAIAWVQQVSRSRVYDAAIELAVRAAGTVDRLYGRPPSPSIQAPPDGIPALRS